MIANNGLTLLGAVVAVHGVAAKVIDVDSARSGGLIPAEILKPLQYCDSGKITLDSDLPCDIEKAADAKLLQIAGLDPAKEEDRNNATKMAAYRKAHETDKISVLRAEAQDCCFKCKLAHKVHDASHDKYWRSFYSPDKIKAWYAEVDAGNKKVPLLWEYLREHMKEEVPQPKLDAQLANVTKQSLDSYCPRLVAPKEAALTVTAKQSVTFPGPCQAFYVAAKASIAINSAKFPSNITVSSQAELKAERFASCPLNHVNGAQGVTTWGAAVKVEGSIKADAKTVNSLPKKAECTICSENNVKINTVPSIDVKLAAAVNTKVTAAVDNKAVDNKASAPDAAVAANNKQASTPEVAASVAASAKANAEVAADDVCE